MMATLEERADAGREEHDHAAFGLALRIDSRISVPGLGRSSGSAGVKPAQLPSCIRLDAAELERRWRSLATAPVRVREVSAGEALVRTVDFAESAGYLLWARDYGRVLISPDGLELLCEPDPANGDWASILSSQALPLAATLRGFEVLHASGVVLSGRALLIAGPSGAGKSSLAAALIRSGGQLLSDDVVALWLGEGALTAYPGSIALQLREDEDRRLSAKERAVLGRPERACTGKQRYVSARAPEPVPLGGLFLIERSTDEPTVERLETVNPFELIASTFNLSVRTPTRLRRQLDVVSAIAVGKLAHRLRVQPGVDATGLAEIIQENVPWADVRGKPARSGAGMGHERPLEL